MRSDFSLARDINPSRSVLGASDIEEFPIRASTDAFLGSALTGKSSFSLRIGVSREISLWSACAGFTPVWTLREYGFRRGRAGSLTPLGERLRSAPSLGQTPY
jgi:hypothetical protein